MFTENDFFAWCEEKHASVNHMYNGYIPYKLHLRLSHKIGLKFKHLWTDESIPFFLIECGIFSHDIIENTNTSYNDLLSSLNPYGFGPEYRKFVTEISYALSDG